MNDQTPTTNESDKNSKKAEKPSKTERLSDRGKTFEGKGTEKKG